MDQFIKLALRDGMNGTAGAVEFVALAEASRFEFPWRKLAVLTMQNGISATTERCEGSVNERAEIVGMDDMGTHAVERPHKRPDGSQGEAAVLTEHA